MSENNEETLEDIIHQQTAAQRDKAKQAFEKMAEEQAAAPLTTQRITNEIAAALEPLFPHTTPTAVPVPLEGASVKSFSYSVDSVAVLFTVRTGFFGSPPDAHFIVRTGGGAAQGVGNSGRGVQGAGHGGTTYNVTLTSDEHGVSNVDSEQLKKDVKEAVRNALTGRPQRE